MGVNANMYSGQSFKRGSASAAFKAGVSLELVKLHGDWQSDAYLKYLTMGQKLSVSNLCDAQFK